jgi:hypothetical protein
LYAAALGLWIWATHREGGIGIGVRFLYAFSLVHLFLIGPPLYFISGLAETYEGYRNREQAVQLVLISMIGFVCGGYFLTPMLLQRRLRLDRAWLPFAHPARLARQWQVGKALVAAGALALLCAPVMFRFNTVRAVWSQVTLLVETGLVIMCVHGILSQNPRRIRAAFLILMVAGAFRVVAAGFFGGTAMTGLFLCSLIFMARGISPRAWVYLGLALYLMLIPYGIWISGRSKLRAAIMANASLLERAEAFDFEGDSPLLFNLFDPDDVKRIQHRIDQSHLLAAVIVHTPAKEPYAWGETMTENVLIALIPRFIWPSKPLASGGSEFVSRYTGMTFDKKTSVGVNYLFEFYVNFGPIGTVIGLLLLGLACGVLEYKFFELAPRSFAFEWTTILCMWTVCVNSDLISQLAMTLPVGLFVGWALARFFEVTRLAPVYFAGGYVVNRSAPGPRRHPVPS